MLWSCWHVRARVEGNQFINCTGTSQWTGGGCDGGATEVSIGNNSTVSGVTPGTGGADATTNVTGGQSSTSRTDGGEATGGDPTVPVDTPVDAEGSESDITDKPAGCGCIAAGSGSGGRSVLASLLLALVALGQGRRRRGC
jgi:hypothetical protein